MFVPLKLMYFPQEFGNAPNFEGGPSREKLHRNLSIRHIESDNMINLIFTLLALIYAKLISMKKVSHKFGLC